MRKWAEDLEVFFFDYPGKVQVSIHKSIIISEFWLLTIRVGVCLAMTARMIYGIVEERKTLMYAL